MRAEDEPLQKVTVIHLGLLSLRVIGDKACDKIEQLSRDELGMAIVNLEVAIHPSALVQRIADALVDELDAEGPAAASSTLPRAHTGAVSKGIKVVTDSRGRPGFGPFSEH